MKKAGSRILIITFGIMAAIAILYPWKFVPEYGILQMTESGEKAGKTAESQESDEEYASEPVAGAVFWPIWGNVTVDHRKCSGRGTSETAR